MTKQVYGKLYYRSHKAMFAERSRAYREAHREELKAYDCQYYQQHKVERKVLDKAYRFANKDRIIDYLRKYRMEHREELNAKLRVYYHNEGQFKRYQSKQSKREYECVRKQRAGYLTKELV